MSQIEILNQNEDPEMYKINVNLFGDDKFNGDNYENSEKTINLLEVWMDENHFDKGTKCKYHRKLYSYLRTTENINIESLKHYSEHLKNIESEYRSMNTEKIVSLEPIPENELMSLNEKLIEGINKTKHQSLKIIGKYYLLIDYNDPLMCTISLCDFEKTTINKSLGEIYYLDLETRIWKLNDKQITVSQEFVDYVKEQHGKRTATNHKYLVGKMNTFEKYSKSTGTSTFSKLFKEIFCMEYSVYSKIIRQYQRLYVENTN